EIARDAWAAAALHADGAAVPPEYARGVALWGKGVALSFLHQYDDAERSMAESVQTLAPALRAPGGDTLSPAQTAYAQSLAWLATLVSKRLSEHPNAAPPQIGIPEVIGATPGTHACALHGTTFPEPLYPQQALQSFGVGAVVLRMRTDATGA